MVEFDAVAVGGPQVNRLAHAMVRRPFDRNAVIEQALERGEVIVAVVPYADMDRAVIDGRTAGFCKLIVDRSTRLILGAPRSAVWKTIALSSSSDHRTRFSESTRRPTA